MLDKTYHIKKNSTADLSGRTGKSNSGPGGLSGFGLKTCGTGFKSVPMWRTEDRGQPELSSRLGLSEGVKDRLGNPLTSSGGQEAFFDSVWPLSKTKNKKAISLWRFIMSWLHRSLKFKPKNMWTVKLQVKKFKTVKMGLDSDVTRMPGRSKADHSVDHSGITRAPWWCVW